MTEIIKLYGGPGCGKTTTMVGNTDIDDYQGILQRKFEEEPATNLMLIAYTRSAADEAKRRLSKLTSVKKKTLDKRITTIHSLTMGMTGIYPQKIVEIRNQNDKYRFCNEQDIRYERDDSDDDDIMDTPDDPGHQFFQIHSWLMSNLKPMSQWKDCPISSVWDNELHDFEEVAEDWDLYKGREGIYEFDDVIKRAVDEEYTVDARELFVDEVQDLYPLQQAFLGNQMSTIERIWLAGDDDQTIYEWAGANPDYFIDIEGNVDNLDDKYWDDKSGYWDSEGVYILNQSWRMPSEVMQLSQKCIESVDERQEKKLKPHHDGGSVTYLDRPSGSVLENNINPDDTFILCRANYQCNNVGRKLIQRGIPYNDRFKTWRKSTVLIRDACAALYDTDREYVSGKAASQLVGELKSDQLDGNNAWGGLEEQFTGKEVPVEELADVIKGRRVRNDRRVRELIDACEDRNYYQQEAIWNNIRLGNADMVPDGITVETIHWSKGQEADTVILSLNTTQTVGRTDDGDMPDAERRLYYVGMTRTENNLVLAKDLDGQSPSFSGEDLFGEDWEEMIE